MSINISKEKCIKCGQCVDICPEDILQIQETVKVIYPQECCWCGACELDCPVGAIRVRFTNQVGPIFLIRGEF